MNDPQREGHMASHIGRRKFLATLGGAAAWPLAARAQQAPMPVVGYLTIGAGLNANNVKGFRKGLSEMGFVEGRHRGRAALAVADPSHDVIVVELHRVALSRLVRPHWLRTSRRTVNWFTRRRPNPTFRDGHHNSPTRQTGVATLGLVGCARVRLQHRRPGFSAAKREMQAETFAHQDEGADRARRGPADDLSGSVGRRDRRACALPLCQRTPRGMRQVFMAGPNDAQVEAPTFLRVTVTHNGGGCLAIPKGGLNRQTVSIHSDGCLH
jgi:hypothetical protein